MLQNQQGKNIPLTRKELLKNLEHELDRIDPEDTVYTEIRQNAPRFSEHELLNLLTKFQNTSTISNASRITSLTSYSKTCLYNFFGITGHGGYAEYSRS